MSAPNTWTSADVPGRPRITTNVVVRFLQLGELVTWIHTPRGGYGYEIPVDAKILALKGDRATIEVQTKDGRTVKRRVLTKNLRRRPR